MIFNTEKELLDYTNQIIGKTFGDFDKSHVLTGTNRDKGILGKLVETGFYGFKNNSDAKADFDNLGIELKVTGFKTNKNHTISAKERLSLSMINYMDIIHETYKFSKLLFKNEKILIIWYEYEKGKSYSDFVIKKYQLYNMGRDELIFLNDFRIIQNKILQGRAHELSEGDTSYLGACTKGADSTASRTQPMSPIEAKPRAFSLKNSYMTGVLRSINQAFIEREFRTVEEYVSSKLSMFIGMTQNELWTMLGGHHLKDVPPYHIGKMISNAILGRDESLPRRDELFTRVSCIIKNLPVYDDFYPIERLTFKNLCLSDFEDPWDESEWKTFFEEVTIILICYKGEGRRHGDRVLSCVRTLTFNADDIDLFGKTYDMVRDAIMSRDTTKLPYPEKFNVPTLVIAPKGRMGGAYGDFFTWDRTKTCFMLDKEFIYSKLKLD